MADSGKGGGGKRARKPSRQAPRAPGWGKEAVLREMAEGVSVRSIAARYAVSTTPAALITEIVRWRTRDPDFAARYNAILDRQSHPRRQAAGAKSKVEADPSLGDWQLRYCEALFETGSRLKAAEAPGVPYSWKHIHQMLLPRYPQYDPDFAEMVHLVEMRFCAQMEAGMVEAFREADNPRDKAWIAKQWLERRDATRWGKQVEMIHSGQVHHKHEVETKTREELLAELLEDQQRFLSGEPGSSAGRALPPAPEAVPQEVIDVEIVSPAEVKAHAVQEGESHGREPGQAG